MSNDNKVRPQCIKITGKDILIYNFLINHCRLDEVLKVVARKLNDIED